MGRIVNLGKEPSANFPDAANYKFLVHSPALTSLTEILNINGSGWIKSAFNLNISSPPCYSQIKLIIDGVVFLHINNTTIKLGAVAAQGFIKNILGHYDTSDYPILPFSITDNIHSIDGIPLASAFTFNSQLEQNPTNGGCLFIPDELVRFEKSLVISVKKELSNIKTTVEYFLDN